MFSKKTETDTTTTATTIEAEKKPEPVQPVERRQPFADKPPLGAQKQNKPPLGAQNKKDTSSANIGELSSPDHSVISEAITISGDVSSRDQLIVHGKIKGDMNCASLIVGEKGQIDGNIVAEEIIVFGEVEGAIRGGRVSLHKSARVQGDIYHQDIAIEMGTIFDGSLRRTENPTQMESDKSESSENPSYSLGS
ncbi:MAG: bactofilin family protein [Methyloligellaceae bacterium]